MSGGKNIAGSDGTDWRKYNPLNEYNGVTDSTASGSSRVIKQIIGKGYINECTMMCNNIVSAGYVKITIDDVVIVNNALINSGTIYGILNKNHITYNANNATTVVPTLYTNNGNIDVFTVDKTANTYNSGTYGNLSSLIIQKPLFFNKNFTLEFVSGTASSKTIVSSIQGGYK